MSLKNEIKRKLFHQLGLLYLLIYWIFPRTFCVWFLGVVLVALGSIEFVRLRRPEVNAWFLKRFGGIHREAEIMKVSGIFWTLLGCWATMVIFTNPRIVKTALGFLIFGDTAAALVGQKWGKTPWKSIPAKTMEGSAAFAGISMLWALFFLRWPVAITGALSGAWFETRKLPYNDNLWLPLGSAAALSLLNLVLGR